MGKQNQTPTKQELRQRMDDSLAEFLAFMEPFSEEQMMKPTDAAGWNVRDHLTHIFAWADGVTALLKREDRWSAMGLKAPIYKDDGQMDLDAMNDEIMRKYRHLSASDALAEVEAAHHRMAVEVDALAEEDLSLPMMRFVAPFTGDEGSPIYKPILGDTERHYKEHASWIQTIVDRFPET